MEPNDKKNSVCDKRVGIVSGADPGFSGALFSWPITTDYRWSADYHPITSGSFQPTHSKNMAVCHTKQSAAELRNQVRSVPCRERGARLNNTGLLNSDTRAVLLSDCMQMRSAQITESFVRRFRSTFPGESCCLVSLFITRRSCRALLCLFSLAVMKEGRTPLKRHSTGLPSVSFVRRFRSTIPGESCCLVSLFITRR